MENFGFQVTMKQPIDETFQKLSDSLKVEGFGILTQIDVQDTLKEKIGIDFRRYLILGVCNPTLAHQALSSNAEAGLLLPCNITLDSEIEGSTIIRILDPVKMLEAGSLGEDEVFMQVASEARKRLLRVAESLK